MRGVRRLVRNSQNAVSRGSRSPDHGRRQIRQIAAQGL
jgi:hypothetical protein